MNVFKELVLSIYDFKSYKEFLKNKGGKVFLAGLILMVVYFFLTVVVPFISFGNGSGGLRENIEKYVPEFDLSNGTLWVEEPFEYEEGGMYVCIDTDPTSVFYDTDEIGYYISDYSQVILMDSEKIIIKDKGEIQGMYFSDLGLEFDKDDLMGFVPYVYGIVVCFMIVAFIFMTGMFFFGVLFVALIGMIVASCMKYQLTFGQLYQMGVYARTLPLLIKAIISFLPFTIPMYWIFNFGLSVLYLVLAIQKMKEQDLQQPIEFVSEQDNYFR